MSFKEIKRGKQPFIFIRVFTVTEIFIPPRPPDLSFHLVSFPFCLNNFLQHFFQQRSLGKDLFWLALPEHVFVSCNKSAIFLYILYVVFPLAVFMIFSVSLAFSTLNNDVFQMWFSSYLSCLGFSRLRFAILSFPQIVDIFSC